MELAGAGAGTTTRTSWLRDGHSLQAREGKSYRAPLGDLFLTRLEMNR
jgi:hypothetical protein